MHVPTLDLFNGLFTFWIPLKYGICFGQTNVGIYSGVLRNEFQSIRWR